MCLGIIITRAETDTTHKHIMYYIRFANIMKISVRITKKILYTNGKEIAYLLFSYFWLISIVTFLCTVLSYRVHQHFFFFSVRFKKVRAIFIRHFSALFSTAIFEQSTFRAGAIIIHVDITTFVSHRLMANLHEFFNCFCLCLQIAD